MTLRPREIFNVFLGIAFLFSIGVIVTHLMASPRPPWSQDVSWWVLAFVCASALLRDSRRRRWRREMQDVD